MEGACVTKFDSDFGVLTPLRPRASAQSMIRKAHRRTDDIPAPDDSDDLSQDHHLPDVCDSLDLQARVRRVRAECAAIRETGRRGEKFGQRMALVAARTPEMT